MGSASSTSTGRPTSAAPSTRPSQPVHLSAREEQLRIWMLKGLDGDSRCQMDLLRTIRPFLVAFFGRRMGGDPGEVEDLVQDVLLAVHERRASYDRARPFTPWLFAIARYKLIDHYRRRPRRHEPVERLEDILATEGFEASSDARMDIASLLGTLPPKQARAIRDTRLHEMTVAEAARMQGIGESDVKVSAHRGIKALMGRVARAAA